MLFYENYMYKNVHENDILEKNGKHFFKWKNFGKIR